MHRLLPHPKKKFWKKKRLPSTLDMEPSPSTWNPRPSTLDPRQKDRLLRAMLITSRRHEEKKQQQAQRFER